MAVTLPLSVLVTDDDPRDKFEAPRSSVRTECTEQERHHQRGGLDPGSLKGNTTRRTHALPLTTSLRSGRRELPLNI